MANANNPEAHAQDEENAKIIRETNETFARNLLPVLFNLTLNMEIPDKEMPDGELLAWQWCVGLAIGCTYMLIALFVVIWSPALLLALCPNRSRAPMAAEAAQGVARLLNCVTVATAIVAIVKCILLNWQRLDKSVAVLVFPFFAIFFGFGGWYDYRRLIPRRVD